MAEIDFNWTVELRGGPGANIDPDTPTQGQLGNLVNWMTGPRYHPSHQAYVEVALPNGETLDYAAIKALSQSEEFAEWRANS